MTDFLKMSKEELVSKLQGITKAETVNCRKDPEQETSDKEIPVEKSDSPEIPSWQDISKAYHPVQMKDGQRVISPEEYEAEKLANKVVGSDGVLSTSDPLEIKEIGHLSHKHQLDGSENMPTQVRYKENNFSPSPSEQQQKARKKVETDYPKLTERSKKDTAKSDGEPEIPTWAQIAKGEGFVPGHTEVEPPCDSRAVGHKWSRDPEGELMIKLPDDVRFAERDNPSEGKDEQPSDKSE